MARKDHLVASAPAWPSDEVYQTVVENNRSAYYRHLQNAQQRMTNSQALTSECDRLSREIADMRLHMAEKERELEEKAHQQRVEAHYVDVEINQAKGYAVACEALGAPVPPPDGELSLNPDGSLSRFLAATDEQHAAEGHRL